MWLNLNGGINTNDAEKPKDDPPQAKFEVTLPMQLESYTAISSFEADSSNQLSIVKGDVVEVVQKNKNGCLFIL